MYKEKSALFLLCETPLHAGSGDDLGLVDLPIQRERHTSFPKIESSSLKGALREAFENKADSKNKKFAKWEDADVMVHRLFGYDEAGLNDAEKERLKEHFRYLPENSDKPKDGHDRAGCLAFTDARLLLFPVKSMKGVFVWLTCPQVLSKLAADMGVAQVEIPFLEKVKALEVASGKAIAVSDDTLIRHKDGHSVVLEEYAFEAYVSNDLKYFAAALAELVFAGKDMAYWRQLLPKNLILLNDTDFRDFTEMSTEVITRIKIDNETGTVQEGALFTEEYLPNDAVMYALVMASDEFGKNRKTENAAWVMNRFGENIKDIALFQLGGNATLGKGILRTQFKKGQNNG